MPSVLEYSHLPRLLYPLDPVRNHGIPEEKFFSSKFWFFFIKADKIPEDYPLPDLVKYLVWRIDKDEEEVPIIKGYIQFTKNQRPSGLYKLFGELGKIEVSRPEPGLVNDPVRFREAFPEDVSKEYGERSVHVSQVLKGQRKRKLEEIVEDHRNRVLFIICSLNIPSMLETL